MTTDKDLSKRAVAQVYGGKMQEDEIDADLVNQLELLEADMTRLRSARWKATVGAPGDPSEVPVDGVRGTGIEFIEQTWLTRRMALMTDRLRRLRLRYRKELERELERQVTRRRGF